MAKQRIKQLMDILRGAKAGAADGPGGGLATLTGLEQFAHFCRHAGQSFVRNRCLVRASALSYSSLLALIPMLAVVISVTSGLLKSEGEDQIYGLINQMVEVLVPPATVTNTVPGLALTATNGLTLPTTNTIAGGATNVVTGTNMAAAGAGGNADMVQAQKEAARSIHEFVQKTQSSALGLVGMLLLVYVAISMLAPDSLMKSPAAFTVMMSIAPSDPMTVSFAALRLTFSPLPVESMVSPTPLRLATP